MFFTRAQLGRKASPQLERDLREVMERIDQVQLLVSEMQRSVREVDSLDSRDALVAAIDNEALEPAASSAFLTLSVNTKEPQDSIPLEKRQERSSFCPLL